MNLKEKIENNAFLGAILGDVVGSRFEWHNRKSKDFTMFHKEKCRFTDDSVLTISIMDSFNKGIQDNQDKVAKNMQEWAKSYPLCGYGANFKKWIYLDDPKPYNSFGNGSAARISPVAFYAKDQEELDRYIYQFTAFTHNHEEGMKGARVIANCVYKALHGATKHEISEFAKGFYFLDFDYQDLVRNYGFDVSCQGSVPQAIYCFLISESLEDCLRTAVSIGGDTDTIAAIACSIGAAYYDDPNNLLGQVKEFLEDLNKNVDDFKQLLLNRL